MTVLRGPTFLSPGEEPLLVHRFLTWWRDVMPYCAQFTSRGSPPSPCSGYPTSTARLETTSRKTQRHLAPYNWGRPCAFELRLRDCLEKGHYSRRMATYCGHSNAPVEYAMKEEERGRWLWKKKKGEGVIKCRFGSRATNWGPRNWLCGRSSSCSHKVRWAVG